MSVLIFALGFFSCALILFIFEFSGLEIPFGTGLVVSDGLSNAPGDWVGEDDIVVLEDSVILRVKGASLSSYADSGSMVPVLDSGANGIRVIPASEDEVEVGDIVSFRMNGFLIVHRVVEKGIDEDGVYFVVKGDSNLVGDGKIRFKDIEYVTVGIIY